MRTMHPRLATVPVFEGGERYPFCLEGLAAKLPGGRLIATFTAGGAAEPRVENMTFYSLSEDGGAHWRAPEVLFAHASKGVFSTAIAVLEGRVRVYLNTYREETNFAEDMQSYFSDSTDGGERFSVPRSLPGCINNVHIKQAVRVGNRLLLPFSWREIDGPQWSYPAVRGASKPAVVSAAPCDQAALPRGATREEIFAAGAKWGDANTTEYVGVMISDDGGQTYRLRGRLGGFVRNLCEPTLAALPDGSLLMYIRSNSVKTLFASRSLDGGEHWTRPEALPLPTPITKVRLYARKNGDLLLLHNPSTARRSPLSLWISRDGGATWPDKTDLVTDDALPLSYPDGYVDEDEGCLCFCWEDRRNVYFSKWRLDQE